MHDRQEGKLAWKNGRMEEGKNGNKACTHHSPLPLPRPSGLPFPLSRLEFWPAAARAEAKLDGRLDDEAGIVVDVQIDGGRYSVFCIL